ncbi:MAG: MBL fold metallo-hydrolase [Planctomycetaceae bacterium]
MQTVHTTLTGILHQQLDGFSGPFSTWIIHVPSRTMFDAGEGISTWLRSRVFLPDTIFLSHAHYDHVGGLPGFLASRLTMRGDRMKRLRIYYPAEAECQLEPIRQMCRQIASDACELTTWTGLHEGDRINVRNWTVECFRAYHGVPSLGYRILENRNRLKSQFRQLHSAQIKELRLQGIEITEEYEHNVFAITGDTGPGIAPMLLEDVDVLLHECTFLDGEERVGNHHSTMTEAFDFACKCNAKSLVLYHFSQRNGLDQIVEKARELAAEHRYAGTVYAITGFLRPTTSAYDESR